MYYVYEIVINDQRVYVGMTNNIKKRTYRHNYDFKKGVKKQLYDYLRQVDYTDPIKLIVIREFTTRVEAKRWEALLILTDYFDKQLLYQKPPAINGR